MYVKFASVPYSWNHAATSCLRSRVIYIYTVHTYIYVYIYIYIYILLNICGIRMHVKECIYYVYMLGNIYIYMIYIAHVL